MRVIADWPVHLLGVEPMLTYSPASHEYHDHWKDERRQGDSRHCEFTAATGDTSDVSLPRPLETRAM
jgi:hypothetical protein